MYIYKRYKGKYNLVDYVDSKDSFIIEERLIKLFRKERDSKNVYSIKSKFTGLFTVYYFGGTYALITSEYLLNEDGTVKTENPITA